MTAALNCPKLEPGNVECVRRKRMLEFTLTFGTAPADPSVSGDVTGVEATETSGVVAISGLPTGDEGSARAYVSVRIAPGESVTWLTVQGITLDASEGTLGFTLAALSEGAFVATAPALNDQVDVLLTFGEAGQ